MKIMRQHPEKGRSGSYRKREISRETTGSGKNMKQPPSFFSVTNILATYKDVQVRAV